MQTLLLVVGSIAILVVAVSFAVLVGGILREMRKVGQASEDLSSFLKTAEEELSGTLLEARTALDDIDKLIVEVTDTVGHVNSVAAGTERLVEGAQAATATIRSIKSSSAGLISVYEGVKQGIRTLCGSQETSKEDTTNEQ